MKSARIATGLLLVAAATGSVVPPAAFAPVLSAAPAPTLYNDAFVSLAPSPDLFDPLASPEPSPVPDTTDPFFTPEPSAEPGIIDPLVTAEPSAAPEIFDPLFTAEPSAVPEIIDPLVTAEPSTVPDIIDPLVTAEPSAAPEIIDPLVTAEPSAVPEVIDPLVTAEPSALPEIIDPLVTAEPSAVPEIIDPLVTAEPSTVPEIIDPLVTAEPSAVPEIIDPLVKAEPSAVPEIVDPVYTAEPSPFAEEAEPSAEEAGKIEQSVVIDRPHVAVTPKPYPTTTPTPAAHPAPVGDACEHAFSACNLRFAGSEAAVPSFAIDGAADVAFTPALVWRDGSVRVGVANANVEGEFVTDAGALPFSQYDTGAAQAFSRTQFKTYALAGKQASGVGHETFQGNAHLAKGKCVRVRVTSYQLLDGAHPPNVSGNVNDADECVVFRTAL